MLTDRKKINIAITILTLSAVLAMFIHFFNVTGLIRYAFLIIAILSLLAGIIAIRENKNSNAN